MDVEYELRGIRYRWDVEKARRNIEKHGVTFEEPAAQVYFDPFVRYEDASENGEQRDAAVGSDFEFRVLFVVHIVFENAHIRIISARRADARQRKSYEDGND
jgi:uncharacterized protein